MIGNVGILIVKEILLILKKNNVFVVGFFIGFEFLCLWFELIINYCVIYVEEIEVVVKIVLNVGVKFYEICVYV